MNNRRDFQSQALDESRVPDNPFELFEKWFSEVMNSELLDPYAFSLATCSKNGTPSLRVVYMRDISVRGISFFTNYHSRKGRDISENPNVCGNFFWAELNRQIRFNGKAEILPAKESDEYFNSRPRESKIGAWASNQSSTLESRGSLEEALESFTSEFDQREVPRPTHWGGYRIKIDEMEFWQGRESRLHDRILYTKMNEDWIIKRLSP